MPNSTGCHLGSVVTSGFTRHRKIVEHMALPYEDLMTHTFICGASGFGSNDSRCDTPPVMKRKITRFAVPG